MRQNWVRVGAWWALLTAIGEFAVWRWDFMPLVLSEEGAEIDWAIRVLNYYSVPVMAFVLVMGVYSIVVFRARGEQGEQGDPEGDGAPIVGSGAVPWVWFAVTTGLAVLVFFYPGLSGLRALQAEERPELTVQVEAVQWHWNVTYPGAAEIEDAPELVLPNETRIRLELTSTDVIHSLWVPAFRLKQDAVPGRVTTLDVTTTETGTFGDDPGVRVQCAELCGTGHPAMRMPLRVVEQAEFEQFLAEQPSGSEGEMEDMDMEESDG